MYTYVFIRGVDSNEYMGNYNSCKHWVEALKFCYSEVYWRLLLTVFEKRILLLMAWGDVAVGSGR